jgi:hypothetical protein
LSERQKEALALGIAIDLVVSRLAFCNQGVDPLMAIRTKRALYVSFE